MSRLARWTLPLLLALGLGSCTSTYVRLDFSPSPAQSVIDDGEGASQARVLASVLAAERPERDPERPFELHLRLRLENLGEAPVSLELGSLLLVDAALNAFPAPRLELAEGDASAGALSVGPHSARSFDLFFPMHERASPSKLGALNLRLQLRVGEREVLVGANFEKRRKLQVLRTVDPGFYGPFYGPYYGHSSLSITRFQSY